MSVDKTLLSGSTSMLLLKLLEEKDLYGYEMIESLRARSNNVFELKAGTLYPLLHSLEEKGFLTSYEKEIGGKTRKYYSITEAGKKHLIQKKKEWNEYSQAVAGILTFSAEGCVMDKRQFLEAVTEQIRFEKAREMISDELENHIEDQKEAFMSEGISETESYQKAIEDMGDPVEVGISLDRIHRPKMEWKMILLVLGLSILGLFFQYVMFKDMGSETYPYNINSQCVYIMIGLAVMMFFCFFDYTRIGFWGKTGAAVLLLLLLYSYFGGLSVFGQRGYLRVGGLSVSLRQLIYLYIPFYGGILYSYKNQGRKGFTKSMVWSVLPVVLVLKLPDLSTAGSLMLIMLIQVCFITRKGWFGEWKKKLAFVVSAVIGLPVFLILYFVFFGAEYQKARLFSVFSTAGDQSYQINMARNLISGSKWIGEGRLNAKGFLPAAASDYIVTYVMSYYGILAVIVLLAVLGLFVFKTFKISVHQKNQLGTVIGVGCSLVFMIQIVLYVMVNLTIFPSTAVFLPLFTYGGTGTIVSFALIGILLSIYRYQNVLPVHMVRKQKVKLGL